MSDEKSAENGADETIKNGQTQASVAPEAGALNAEAAQADDDEALVDSWASGTTQLDQDGIDSLFGEPTGPKVSGPRSGLEVLVGNVIVGYDRLPMLDIVVDRFARSLTTSIRKYTSDNCDISISKGRAVRVGDFLNRISLPAMIAVIRCDQWDGYMLAALNAPLIGSVVDVLLGGRRNQAQAIEGRPYTPIERTLIERMVGEVVITDLKKAFDQVCDIDFVAERYETTPTYAAITELSAAAVTFRADVAMDGGRGGWIDFLIPYSTLEPVRDVLSQEFIGKKSNGDSIWHSHLHDEVPQAMVELQAVLEQRMARVLDVARWREGSVLVLDRRASDLVEVFCEDALVARAHIGEHDGRIALRVEEHCKPMLSASSFASVAIAAANIPVPGSDGSLMASVTNAVPVPVPAATSATAG